MKEGDMGLSRVNRVLIPVAYRLIKMKKKVMIRGKDIGAGLIALIKKLAPVSIEDLLFKVEKYEATEFKKLLVAEKLAHEDDGIDHAIHSDTIARLSKKNQQKLENILDKTGCITALADGVDSIAVLVKNITDIFADFDDDGKPKDAIVLGTVHRTKGLEAHNVYMIDPENFPHSMATKTWEMQQERNLAYVGVTRAKFVVDKDGNVIEPGRLIFIGACPTIFRAEWLIGHAVYPAKPMVIAEVETPMTPQQLDETRAVYDKPVVKMTEMEELRLRLVAFYVKNKTPVVVAQQMVTGMSDTHVRQCAMVMPI
jgi:superfamily I DNA/RNA helicase